MPYKVDYPDPGTVVTWTLTDEGAERERRAFHPTMAVAAPDGTLSDARALLADHPLVHAVRRQRRRTGWRRDPTEVLAVSTVGLDAVDELARTLAREGRPGTYRLFDVDFTREFRYCLETGADPTPARTPTVLRLSTPPRTFAEGTDLASVTVGDDAVTGSPEAVAAGVAAAVADRDPDVLRVSSAALVPLLFAAAARPEDEYCLGREPGYETLAGQSTVESYGRVGDSPARYNVPGRAIVDESNAFWLAESNLEGVLDLVARSHKPLQETAWASIGNVLTAIQVRHARERGVLVPWRSWRHERFTTARTLNDADRGGVTFAPDVGVHDDVHELDFASLYPNIIREHNLSPETVRCDCHPEREDVPGLGYGVCPEPGYLPEVLGPIVDDRDAIKAELRAADDPERVAALEGRSAALKWILVSCFGYQGFANAKFGRIECHEAINAYAREILLDAKDALEREGWRVVHGIVDSLWVTAAPDRDQTPLEEVAAAVSADAGVRLEHEAAYDWIAFCPRRDAEAGALTRYFGHEAGAAADDPDGYKYRGIELRQRSTPPFLEGVQRALVETYARTRDPEAVVERLRAADDRLAAGSVPAPDLAVRNRVSQPLSAYTQATRTVAALRRTRARGLEKRPGQDVEYVVVDDAASGRERVRLLSEDPETYDAAFYRAELRRVAESVLAPMGWREADVRAALSEHTDASLDAFGA